MLGGDFREPHNLVANDAQLFVAIPKSNVRVRVWVRVSSSPWL